MTMMSQTSLRTLMLKEKEKRRVWTEQTGPIGRTRNRLVMEVVLGKGKAEAGVLRLA